jgi:four helix bundle protein
MIYDFRLLIYDLTKQTHTMKEEIKRRTKDLALAIIKMSEGLSDSIAGRHISSQILRSATYVAANYRAVCRARSDKEFIAKPQSVIEEADETLFWIEMIVDQEWADKVSMSRFYDETNQLLSIFVKSAKTIKSRIKSETI